MYSVLNVNFCFVIIGKNRMFDTNIWLIKNGQSSMNKLQPSWHPLTILLGFGRKIRELKQNKNISVRRNSYASSHLLLFVFL